MQLENNRGEHAYVSQNTGKRQWASCRFAFVYTPLVQPVNMHLDWAAGPQVRAWCYNPRTGSAMGIGEFAAPGRASFHRPVDGPDWVLVLDDVSEDFAAPGLAG